MQYIGRLDRSDPLYEYLKWDIFPQIQCDGRDGVRVFSTNGSNAVYVYEDRATCRRVVGKFFYSERMNDWDLAGRRLDREYRNINHFRSFLSGPHYAARALGCNYDLNRLLMVEYCYGEPLDTFIMQTINSGRADVLYDKLRALAWFLAEVHNKSARNVGVNFHNSLNYANIIVDGLKYLISPGEADHLRWLLWCWEPDPAMWSDCEVLVHGDATPSNFFFGDGMNVITFDLERVKHSDRIFDVGRLAGELQHFFLRSTGNKYLAEPFISHFLWEYACHFPDRERTFEAICRRVPFYMGCTLLRIARNTYLDDEYRHKLVAEAKECLRKR